MSNYYEGLITPQVKQLLHRDLQIPVMEVLVGSRSFGVNRPNSDYDILIVMRPPNEALYPYSECYYKVYGFHDVDTCEEQRLGKVNVKWTNGEIIEADVRVISLVKYMRLLMNSSPDLLESLYVRDCDVLWIHSIGERLRDFARIFISKNMFYSFNSLVKDVLLQRKGRKHSRKELQHALRVALELKHVMRSDKMEVWLPGYYMDTKKLFTADASEQALLEELETTYQWCADNEASWEPPLSKVHYEEVEKVLLHLLTMRYERPC